MNYLDRLPQELWERIKRFVLNTDIRESHRDYTEEKMEKIEKEIGETSCTICSNGSGNVICFTCEREQRMIRCMRCKKPLALSTKVYPSYKGYMCDICWNNR